MRPRGRFGLSGAPGAQLMEERRELRVGWDQAVPSLARRAAWYAFTAGSSLAGLAVLLLEAGGGRRLGLATAVIFCLLCGISLSGIVGLAVLIYQDRAYDYEPVRTRRSWVQVEEEPEELPALEESGPLYREISLRPYRARYGRISLDPAQRLALARLVLLQGQTRLSGRVLEAAGVIGDRNLEAAALQEDLIVLGYAERDGQTIKATAALADHLELYLPPTPEEEDRGPG